MTREEILNMKAGTELNILVAEEVMGWEREASPVGLDFWRTLEHPFFYVECSPSMRDGEEIFRPSEDWNNASLVIEKLSKHPIYAETAEESNYRFELDRRYKTAGGRSRFVVGQLGYSASFKTAYRFGPDERAWDISGPAAICKAALIAVML